MGEITVRAKNKDPERLKTLSAELARAGVTNVQITSLATGHLSGEFKGNFGKIAGIENVSSARFSGRNNALTI